MPAFGRLLLSLSRVVVMALAAVVVCAVVPGAASALGLPIGDPAAGPSMAASSADQDFAAGERRDQARSERLASANARAQRTSSRTAHRDLGRDEALALARRTFPEQMTGRLFDGAEPAAGVRVVDQRGDGAALVQDTQTGRRALLMSTLPLQAKRPDGTFAPIDLSLQSTPSGVGPKNSLAPFEVDPTSAASVSFPAKGVSVSVRGGERHTVQTASDRAFFANVLQDTDISVMALPDGAELSVIVRSSQAPERFVLDVTLPAGARLRRAVARDPIPGDPPQSLEIVRGEQTLGYIHPPVAIDADGQPVAATMALDGQDIVLEVSHRDGDIHYPVNIDPEMRLYSDYNAGWLRWAWTQRAGGGGSFGAAKNDCAYYCGLYQSVPTNTTLTNGSVAQWYYPAPVNTYLYRTTFGGISHDPLYAYGYNHTRSYMGLLNAAGTAWETNVNYVNQAGVSGPNPYGPSSGAYYGLQHDFCFNPRCDPTPAAATEQNNAIFGFQAQNAFGGTTLSSGPYKGTNTMAWANVYLGDRRPPSLTTATPTSRDWTNEPAGTTHTITPGVHDDGLGIYGIGLDGAASGGGFVSQGCLGHIDLSPCPADWSHSFTYTLNEGINNLNVYGHDFVDNRTPGGSWTEKIDRGRPNVELPLVGEREPGDDEPAVYVAVDQQNFSLQVAATDALSGVRQVRLLNASNAQIDIKPQTCSPACPVAPSTITLQGAVSALSEAQEYVVEVTDAASNKSEIPVRLVADRTPPPLPTNIHVQDFQLLGNTTATIGWNPEEDPDLVDGQPGSGVAASEYRYQRLLGGFSAWTSTALAQFDIPSGVLLEPINVEVRQVDAAGNRSPVEAKTLLLQPVAEAEPAMPSGGTNAITVSRVLTLAGQTLPGTGTEVVLSGNSGATYVTRMTTDGVASFTGVPDGTYDITTSNGANLRTQTTTVSGNQTRSYSYSDTYESASNTVPVKQTEFCLNNGPKALKMCAAFLEDRKKAIFFAGRLFTNAADGTRGNAFQHSFWVAQMVRSIAYQMRGPNLLGLSPADYPLAIGLAEAHEADARNSDTFDVRRDTAMDKHNNELGYDWAVPNSPDMRGIYHNDEFFCNTLRGRNRLSVQIHFRPYVTSQFTESVVPNRPVYRFKNEPFTANRSRLRPATDFPAGQQPCVKP